jgi:hypothetical protein
MEARRDDPITEGPFDRYVHLPLAERVVRPLSSSPRPPTLDQIALAGLTLGLAGALSVLLAWRVTDWLVPAWLLFAFAVVSRVRRQLAPPGSFHASPLLDVAVGAAFWGVFTMRAVLHAPLVSLLAPLTLLSAFAHIGLFTEIRRRFAALAGEPAADFDAGPLPPPGSFAALVGAVFAAVRGFAEVVHRDFTGLLLGPPPPSPRVSRESARPVLTVPMRMASLLGPDTHLALAYMGALMAGLDIGLSYRTIVLAVVVGLNLWAALVVFAWRRAERLARSLEPDAA